MKWQEIPFKEVAEVVTGNIPPKSEKENYGFGVPWVKPPDLDGFDPITKTEETLSEIGQKKARLLPPGTVMVSCIGSIGKVGIAGTTLATNQQINSLIFGPLIEPKFGYYYCRSITPLLQASARNAVVPILNKSNFENIKIPVPPLIEQQRIVEILDRADALRKKRSEADAKAERILPALFYKMFGDPALNTKGWIRDTLNSIILETQYGISQRADYNNNGVAIIRMNNIDYTGYFNLSDIKYIQLESDSLNQYKLERGDILFNRTNSKELVGKTGLWQEDFTAVPASYLIRVKVNKKKCLPEYIWAYMNSSYMKQILLNKGRRAIGMANINAQELRSLPVIIPDIELQKTFVKNLSILMKLKNNRIESNVKLESLFNMLIYYAFSGNLTAKWREVHMKELLAEIEG